MITVENHLDIGSVCGLYRGSIDVLRSGESKLIPGSQMRVEENSLLMLQSFPFVQTRKVPSVYTKYFTMFVDIICAYLLLICPC